jgi:NADH dehydrogenase (ubiquinone) 1 alpha subcomplex subunit 13
MPQDMPPVGGYEAVQYKRNLPSRGLFRPGPLIAGGAVVMLFGWYKLITGIREQKYVHVTPPHRSRTHREHKLTTNSELAREKMWSRIHLIPLLQAEEDRDQVRRHLADQAREKELMGENVKVYHSDR